MHMGRYTKHLLSLFIMLNIGNAQQVPELQQNTSIHLYFDHSLTFYCFSLSIVGLRYGIVQTDRQRLIIDHH